MKILRRIFFILILLVLSIPIITVNLITWIFTGKENKTVKRFSNWLFNHYGK